MRTPPQDHPPAPLLDRASFPHPVTQLQVRETPLSWVVLTGVFAYKIKKPVRFDFIDASTLARRHFLCEEELRLNRRFAPELYLDVVPMAEQDGRLRIGAAGTPVEYAVRMLEFDSAWELDNQLAQGAVTRQDMAALGRRIAEQHRGAAIAAIGDEYGRPELIRTQLQENFARLRSCLNEPHDLRLLEQLERWGRETVEADTDLLWRRWRNSRVRECHGDLHAGNIVRWREHFVAFDCLEFEPRLRWIDVISDVAFLFMDLMTHARADLGYEFLSAYLEQDGDYEALRLLPLYGVYRALVRAKVDALGIASANPDAARTLWDRLRARLDTAARLMSHRTPALLLMHGVTASGKSWISEQLIAALGAVRMRSDLERRRADAAPHTARGSMGVGAGAYSAPARKLNYARLLDCAESTLAGGCNAIVDATFLDRSDRQMFEALAHRSHYPLLIVSCFTDRPTLEARLRLRSRHADDPSEATLAVLDMQLGSAQPLSDEELAGTVAIDTGAAEAIAAGIRNVQARVHALTAGSAPAATR
jgi:aminoglycoside phosphotransferase family enzyme/predicted kinase